MRQKDYECDNCEKKKVCKYIDDMARINMEILDVIEKESDISINYVITKCTEYKEKSKINIRGL